MDHYSVDGYEVRIFPSTDENFRAAVLATVAVQVRGKPRGHITAAPVETALRREFYRVRVEMQTSLGAFGPSNVIYAFRDGALLPGGGGP